MLRTDRVRFAGRRLADSGAVVLAALVLLGSGAAAETSGTGPKVPPEFEPVRAALGKYRDPVVAVRDGYLSTLGCVQYPDGGMGVHFLNPRLFGPVPDPMAPQILVYEPDAQAIRTRSRGAGAGRRSSPVSIGRRAERRRQRIGTGPNRRGLDPRKCTPMPPSGTWRRNHRGHIAVAHGAHERGSRIPASAARTGSQLRRHLGPIRELGARRPQHEPGEQQARRPPQAPAGRDEPVGSNIANLPGFIFEGCWFIGYEASTANQVLLC